MSTFDQHAEDTRMDLGSLLAGVWARWRRIVGVTVVLLVATVVVLMFVPRMYESSASLLVEQRDNAYTRAANDQTQATATVDSEALMSSQIELIKSRDLLLEVVDSENLRSVPEFTGGAFSPVGFVMQLLGRKPEPKSVDERVLANLADRMTVVRERDSAVISVNVRSSDAVLAARIANALAAAHVKRRAAQSLADTADATVWLQQEIAKLRTKVEAAETAIANYKVDHDLFTGANATPVADQEITTVATQIAEAQQRKNDAQARGELIRGLIDSGQSLEGNSDVRESVVIQRLLETKGNLQSDLAQKSTTLLANHPTIKALKAQIKEVDTQITAEGRKVASSLETEAKVEGDLEQRLRDDLARAKVSAGDATKGGVTLDGLERDAKAQRDLLENYLGKYSDAASRTAANSALPDVRVISEAAPAAEPASPKVPLILAAVGVVALALQVGAALFGDLMSGRSPAEGEIEHEVEPELHDAPDADVETEAEPTMAPRRPVAAEPPPRPASAGVDQLGLVSAAVASGQVRTILIAELGEMADRIAVIDRLVGDALDAGLSAVAVDAGSGTPSPDPGLTDLSAETADYGDVILRASENLAEVPWGRLAAIDRRSGRPLTLVEALADIYHLVLVDTGRIGMASTLPLFAGSRATVILVAGEAESPAAVSAARRDIMALGLEIGRVVTAPSLQADVA